MSLVDYASSDGEDEFVEVEHDHHQELSSSQPSNGGGTAEKVDGQTTCQQSTSSSSPSPAPPSQPSACQPQLSSSSLVQQSQGVSPFLPPPSEKLPDASMLLSSPILSQPVGTDHSSRVAAAMAENASRKREANGSSSSYVRGKIPKGNLPHSKNIPETDSGLLVPPQLRGRSNVVTEDISKLFVQRKSQGNS